MLEGHRSVSAESTRGEKIRLDAGKKQKKTRRETKERGGIPSDKASEQTHKDKEKARELDRLQLQQMWKNKRLGRKKKKEKKRNGSGHWSWRRTQNTPK